MLLISMPLTGASFTLTSTSLRRIWQLACAGSPGKSFETTVQVREAEADGQEEEVAETTLRWV